jgi:DASH complex subunit DAM1
MSKKVSRSSTPHRLSRPSNILPSPGLHYDIDPTRTPLDNFSPSFAELNDNLVDLDSNIQQIQQVHESLVSFNESFSSFLYGLQINAYTVEFNEIPNLKNFKDDEIREKIKKLEDYFQEQERAADETYLTNDDEGSFIAHPGPMTTTTTTTSTTMSANGKSKDRQKSKIPRRTTAGGLYKATKASEGRQRLAVKSDSRPPFR